MKWKWHKERLRVLDERVKESRPETHEKLIFIYGLNSVGEDGAQQGICVQASDKIIE